MLAGADLGSAPAGPALALAARRALVSRDTAAARLTTRALIARRAIPKKTNLFTRRLASGGAWSVRMSDDSNRNAPRMEPWAYVTMSCFIPLVVAALIPRSYRLIPLVVSAALLLAGVVMLFRQEGSLLPREGREPSE